jgi:hypothetical protein
VRRVGLRARIGRPFARILDAQERGEHEQFAQCAPALRLEEHARQRDVDRQARHDATGFGELVLRSAARDGRFLIVRDHGRSQGFRFVVHCAEFGEASITVADRALVRRFDKREIRRIAELEREHAQDHARERGAQDFRIGIAGRCA